MKLSHRWRLTLVSAGSAGVIFLALFALSAAGLRRSEEKAAQRELAPAVNQVAADVRTGSEKADLAEVVQANPNVSLAIFDAKGNLIAEDGKVHLSFQATKGVSGDIVIRTDSVNGKTVVAALPWTKHEAFIDRFQILCASLWLPLVGVVAIATWMTARSTFLPLEQLTKAAEAMSAEGLGARLHAEDQGEYRDFVLRLNGFLDRLEDSVRREERFLSDAAHELRTPLTVLRGELETSLQRPRQPEEYQATMAILLEETTRLSTLVELLLRSGAASHGPPGAVDMRESAERAHARWVDRFSEKGVHLTLTAEPSTAGLSEGEFDVLADNLLTNGLRVSEPGSTCSILVGAVDGKAVLQVGDQGPGIAPENVERIFERFARLDTGRSRTDGGFGIGLALCKEIVEHRGGTIRVEPAVPHGSLFTVTLKSAT